MKILILTNGTYGDYNFCKQDESFDYIICADRGLCHARVLGIMPNLIVGDFDSTNEQDLDYFKEQGVHIETFDTHKDETDTEIAVSKAIQKGATEVTIYGGLGSRLDHNLANVHLLYKLLRAGIKAGVAINPGTPVSVLEPIIRDVDMILVMSVNPGFGGQKFIPYALEKLKQVKALAEKAGKSDLLIQVDGGVTMSNVEEIIAAGANVLVAGSSVFDGKDATSNAAAFTELFARL